MGDELSVRLVDAINAVAGVHAGHRAVHAKGTCATGTFTASAGAAKLSRAAHFQNDPVPVTVRFSNGGGNPGAHDGDQDGRGMAVKFHLPDGSSTDIVSLTLPIFFVRTPEAFLEFMAARVPDPETGAPDMEKVGAFLADHPEAHAAVGLSLAAAPPASYAQLRYHSVHAFRLLDHAGEGRFVRYRIDPEAGEATLTNEEAQALPSGYLAEELASRCAAGPVAFTLFAQLAGEGDPTDDPTAAWPDEREVVELGRIELTEATGAGCEGMVFDPTNVTDGIECSDDKILHARSGAYSVSYARRNDVSNRVPGATTS